MIRLRKAAGSPEKLQLFLPSVMLTLPARILSTAADTLRSVRLEIDPVLRNHGT